MGTAAASILVVDNDEVMRRLLEAQLKVLGIESECCASGRDALISIAERPRRLLLTDVRMPDIDGLELARACRHIEAESDGQRAVIIAMTADVDAGVRDQMKQAGIDACIAKPFSLATLKKVLGQWL